MSDFLDQFKNGNYRKPDEDSAESAAEPAAVPATPVDDAATDAEPPVPSERTGFENFRPRRIDPVTPARRQSGIQGVEHEIVIDRSYTRLKILRYILASFTIITLCVLGFFAYRYFNSIEMLTFEGKNVSEARTWALKNRIELDIQYDFNVQNLNDTIIEQDIEPGASLQKGAVLALVVSKGPDPDERLQLPDLATMTTAQIRVWIEENKATNINLIQEYDKVVPANGFIRMEFTDVSVDASSFTRSDYLIVYMSRGPQPVQEYIRIVDFTGYTRAQVDSWVQSNPVIVTYVEEGSATVAAGQVISQDVAPDTNVAVNAPVTLKISIGAGIAVPDFAATNATEAAAFAPGLTVTVKTQFSNDVPYGALFSQSVAAGELMYGENKKVTVIYSEGRPYIGQLAGKMENELPAYFFAFNSKGCSISYNVTYVDSHIEKGMVVSASRYNEYLWLGSGVEIQVSLGNLPAPTESAQPTQPPQPTSPPSG